MACRPFFFPFFYSHFHISVFLSHITLVQLKPLNLLSTYWQHHLYCRPCIRHVQQYLPTTRVPSPYLAWASNALQPSGSQCPPPLSVGWVTPLCSLNRLVGNVVCISVV